MMSVNGSLVKRLAIFNMMFVKFVNGIFIMSLENIQNNFCQCSFCHKLSIQEA